MCLNVSRDAKMQIAKKDIVVYKHVVPTDDEDKFLSSYRYSDIQMGVKYTSELEDPDDDKEIHVGLHSFKNFKDALLWALVYKEAVVKCVIPKDSAYYAGSFITTGRQDEAFASNQLTYIKVIRRAKK